MSWFEQINAFTIISAETALILATFLLDLLGFPLFHSFKNNLTISMYPAMKASSESVVSAIVISLGRPSIHKIHVNVSILPLHPIILTIIDSSTLQPKNVHNGVLIRS